MQNMCLFTVAHTCVKASCKAVCEWLIAICLAPNAQLRRQLMISLTFDLIIITGPPVGLNELTAL